MSNKKYSFDVNYNDDEDEDDSFLDELEEEEQTPTPVKNGTKHTNKNPSPKKPGNPSPQQNVGKLEEYIKQQLEIQKQLLRDFNHSQKLHLELQREIKECLHDFGRQQATHLAVSREHYKQAEAHYSQTRAILVFISVLVIALLVALNRDSSHAGVVEPSTLPLVDPSPSHGSVPTPPAPRTLAPAKKILEVNIVFVEAETLGIFVDVKQWILRAVSNRLNETHSRDYVTVRNDPSTAGSVVVYLKKDYARINEDMTSADDKKISELSQKGACLISIVFLTVNDFEQSEQHGVYEKIAASNLENDVLLLQKPGDGSFDLFPNNKKAINSLVENIKKHPCLRG